MCTLTSLYSSFFLSQNSIQCHSITFLETLSKAFSRFTKRRHSFLSCCRYFCYSFLTMNKASTVLLPDMKPNCISFSSNIEQMLFSRTLSTIFIDLKDPQFKTFFIDCLHACFLIIWHTFSIQHTLTKFLHHLLSNLII